MFDNINNIKRAHLIKEMYRLLKAIGKSKEEIIKRLDSDFPDWRKDITPFGIDLTKSDRDIELFEELDEYAQG
jgi:hypothetical protein